MKVFQVIAVACMMATAAVSGPFDGAWDFEGYCSVRSSDTRVRISDNMVRYYETQCVMERPTRLRDMGQSVLYDLQCESEGETFGGGRMLLSVTADGRLMSYSNGYSRLRVRC